MQRRTSQMLVGRGRPNVTTKIGPPTGLPTLLRLFTKASLSLFSFTQEWLVVALAGRCNTFQVALGPAHRAPWSRYGMRRISLETSMRMSRYFVCNFSSFTCPRESRDESITIVD